MDLDDHIHLARVESPADAFRSICGAWRRARNWTTVPALVTCPACLARLAKAATGAASAEETTAAGGHSGRRPSHP